MTRPSDIPESALKAETAALITLARLGIPPDIQELLVQGDPMRGIAPGAFRTVILSAQAEATEAAAKKVMEFPTLREAVLAVEQEVNANHRDGATVEDFVPVIASHLASAIRSLPSAQRRGE